MKKKWESFKRGMALFVLAQMMFALISAPVAFASNYYVDQDPSNEPVLIGEFGATISGTFLTGGCGVENFYTAIDGKSHPVLITSTYPNPNGTMGCMRNWSIDLRDDVSNGTYGFVIIYSGNLTVDYPNSISVDRPIELGKVTICHSSGQSGNYQEISIGYTAVSYVGHSGNAHSEDIIPPVGSLVGQKWDERGQAIHANDCVNEFSLIYNGNNNTGGTVPVDNNDYAFNSVAPVSGNTGFLVKIGNSFVGWNTKADGTGNSYQPGSALTIKSNVVLYAMWQEAVQKYTVTFNSNGGSEVDPIEANEGEKITAPAVPEKECYVFDGWFADDEFDIEWNFEEDTVDGNLTLYAKWLEDETCDVKGPQIKLDGLENLEIEYGSAYEEQGATCEFAEEEQESFDAYVSGAVNELEIGEYPITYTCGEEYQAEKTRTVTVIPRKITVTANSFVKIAGQADPVFTYELTSGSLIGSDDFIGNLERQPGEVVGAYQILEGSLAITDNYEITFIPGNLTINPIPVEEEPVAPITPIVTAAVAITPDAPVPAVLGDTDEAEVTSDVTEKEAQEVKGTEETGTADRTCPWWWIVSLILVIALGIVAFIIRDKDEDNFFKKYWYAWPPALGAAAWVAHYFLHNDLRATWFCENFWLVVLFIAILGEIAYKMLLKKSEANGKKK